MTLFGIEYTFLDPKRREHRYDMIAQRLEDKGFKLAHTDPGVVEVPSPPHSSLEDAKKFFDRLGRAVGLEGLIPRLIRKDRWGNDVYYGTGGGHVHVEMPKSHTKRVAFLEQIIPIMANRPWLNWVFNEFMDDNNANSLLSVESVRRYLSDGRLGTYYTGNPCTKYDGLLNLVDDGDLAIRHGNRHETIEFRIFDAPRNWQMVKDHVDFALALVKWANDRADKGFKPEAVYFKRLLHEGNWVEDVDFTKKYRTLKDVRVPFKALCKKLGLSWRRYAKYMQNYKDRLAYGELT